MFTAFREHLKEMERLGVAEWLLSKSRRTRLRGDLLTRTEPKPSPGLPGDQENQKRPWVPPESFPEGYGPVLRQLHRGLL